MGEKVRWGILGNANIARKCVIPGIAGSRNGLLQALGTRAPAEAERLAAENGIRHVYEGYDRVLSDSAVDAVYIPLPNHLHHPWTVRALQAGKHVLCEKPLACSRSEAEDMGRKAGDAGLLLMEAFMYRFHPRSREIKQAVDSGGIGPLRLVRSAFCFRMGEEMLSNADGFRLAPQNGGALMDVGCYGVSVARWLFGSEPTHVQAQATYHPGGADIQLAGTLRFPGGGLATIEASFVSALQQTYTAVGEAGVIELPHDAFIPWDKDTVYLIRYGEDETGQERRVPGADEYRLMVEHFADAVSGRAPLAYPAADSISNMQVMDGLAEAARTGLTVSV